MDLISRVKRINPWHVLLGIFLAGLLLFLSVRASDDYRWSDWGFGDAQTMLSLKQWEEGGWFHNYFLFKPQGYANMVDLLDDPQLRQHAHGTCPGSSPRIGPRLLYTHYPAGYLVPYAALFRIGLDSLFSVRMLSIIFSVSALILMYRVFSIITAPGISFFAVVFYGLTPTFLGYADTLANQPLDDLLRFGFMLAVVMSTRAESELHRSRWLISAWVIEFALSLSSFDSVFFIYAWLVGWDVIDRKGFRLKRYLIFSLAPLSAHGLQFMQNVWYLGLRDAAIDIKDAFLLKNAADPNYNSGEGRVDVIIGSVGILFRNLYTPPYFVAALAAIYAGYAMLIKDDTENRMPPSLLLVLLFLCGMCFVIVLPHAARMPYEARQMIPFTSLLVGALTYSVGLELSNGLRAQSEASTKKEKLRRIGRPFYLLIAATLSLLFWYKFIQQDRQPVYYIPDEQTDRRFAEEIELRGRYDLLHFRGLRADVLFAEWLSGVRTPYDPVFFSLSGFQIFWDPKYVPGYPQIMPITEYYTGSRPVLCFNAPQSAAEDILRLMRSGSQRFSPILVANDPGAIEQAIVALKERGGLVTMVPPSALYSFMDRYALDLTPYLKWER